MESREANGGAPEPDMTRTVIIIRMHRHHRRHHHRHHHHHHRHHHRIRDLHRQRVIHTYMSILAGICAVVSAVG